MNSRYISKLFYGVTVLCVVVFSVSVASSVQAQQLPISGTLTCTSLSYNLREGSTDAYTGGEVSRLQTFLNQENYFPYAAVGIFGPVTYTSVRNFQAAHGISSTGYVGPITRAAIQQMSCGGATNIPTSGLSLQSLSPNLVAIGNTVTLYGTGFTSDNTILLASGAIAHVASYNGTSLSFTVPSTIGPDCSGTTLCPDWIRQLTPGTYNVSIENTYGTSNTLTLTITANGIIQGGYQSPVISSISAPTQLTVGQTGTWTVYATSQTQNGQQLNYAVNWGDGSNNPYSQNFSASTVSSGTFTHAYSSPGTYTSTFTVTDSNGQSNSASASVIVSGQQNQTSSLYIQSLSPSSGVVGTTVTIYGSGFTSNDTVNFQGQGNAYVSSVSSNGTSLSFTVPSTLTQTGSVTGTGYCAVSWTCSYPPTSPGIYNVSVTNGNVTSNALPFTVTTGSTSNISATPSIQSLSPISGIVGTIVTIYGSGFTSNDVIDFGTTVFSADVLNPISISNDGTSISFTIPSTWSSGFLCPTDIVCSPVFIVPGTYGVWVANISTNKISNALSFTVISSGQTRTLQ